MTGGLHAYRLRRLPERRPVLPMAAVIVLVWVGVMRYFWLLVLAQFHPNKMILVNADDLTGFWMILHSPGQWGGTLQGCFSIVNLLLALYLWACLRGLPRGSFWDRSQQLLVYGGAAALLMYLQHALLRVSLVEPAWRVIRVPLTPFQ